ncbi:branched-chain amino acid ABC transporter permease [Modestobacter sp. VKM Ac-2978]|uniref:branched-chain amino acid ABC transporter permease n=1 Tax=Modestobacter sp. VKM Ac-2978 TaxID=3004132 RepID=UPI0022AA210A|nr:branched-chain amino acid ABC transporter permease [Modestobacter sp. VKM Ac-2978]MCZ2849113.1 branched-chain amino acid ABC transporter permease [Modestobacter sp. VKM Ac-2978]
MAALTRASARGRRRRLSALASCLAVVAVAFSCLLLDVTPALAAGEVVQGRLVDAEDQPVPDVEITLSQDGDELATVTSGADGRWEIPVPSPGEYEVSLDEETLPEGAGLRENAAASREVTVDPGAPRNVLFPLGQVEESGAGLGSALAQATLDGLLLGALIGITAIGLSLIFGTTGLINFAHGELVTLGAVIAFGLNAIGLHVVLATLVAMPLVAALAGATELVLWRPMRRRRVTQVSMFIATIGLALLLRQVVLVVFGGNPRSYGDYELQQVWEWGPVSITPRDASILGIALLVLLLVGLGLTRSRLGTAVRSVSDNRALAGCSGINVDRVVLQVWLVGGGLAALGGVLYGLSQAVTWNMGFNLLLLMFAGVILGGLGTAFGAVLGSIVVGLLAQLSTVFFDSELQTVWALLLLILVLLVRPQGLLGLRERVG